MAEKFYLNIRFKNQTTKVIVDDPNSNLDVLVTNLRNLKDPSGKHYFDLPNMDIEGAPVNYLFGKTDENGKLILLHSKKGKTEYCLRDYNVKSGDSIELVGDYVAGGSDI